VAKLARVNQLYFGDNLNVLREHIADESVDLIYLDPPFNSKRDYNLLFKSPPKSVAAVYDRRGKGDDSAVTDSRYSSAQITAFEDSWHWGEQAEREFDEILKGSNTDLAQMMRALRSFLGENDMMAYLTMMANRLLELHRVLKPTGSLYRPVHFFGRANARHDCRCGERGLLRERQRQEISPRATADD